MNSVTVKTFILTMVALVAFAGNSMLCRLALKTMSIDAGSFTLLRLISGAVALIFLTRLFREGRQDRGRSIKYSDSGGWLGGFSLFVYAAFFSYAYVSLDTATGALILFGSVQISLIVYGMAKGEKLSLIEGLGFLVSCAGFAYLLLPELTKPSSVGLALMVVSGCAWAVYTVQGQGSKSPLNDTAYNFTRALPFSLLLFILMAFGLLGEVTLSWRGVLLATASGALTSGIGYAVWYSALRSLSTTVAAVSQLAVPVIAAILAIMFVGEAITIRLLLSSVAVLGGISIVIMSKRSNKI